MHFTKLTFTLYRTAIKVCIDTDKSKMKGTRFDLKCIVLNKNKMCILLCENRLFVWVVRSIFKFCNLHHVNSLTQFWSNVLQNSTLISSNLFVKIFLQPFLLNMTGRRDIFFFLIWRVERIFFRNMTGRRDI